MGGQVCAGPGTLPASKDFQPGFPEQDAGWWMSQRSAVSAPTAPRAQAHSRWVPLGEESHGSHPQPLSLLPSPNAQPSTSPAPSPALGQQGPAQYGLLAIAGTPQLALKSSPSFSTAPLAPHP